MSTDDSQLGVGVQVPPRTAGIRFFTVFGSETRTKNHTRFRNEPGRVILTVRWALTCMNVSRRLVLLGGDPRSPADSARTDLRSASGAAADTPDQGRADVAIRCLHP
jgi:hypothetical protein